MLILRNRALVKAAASIVLLLAATPALAQRVRYPINGDWTYEQEGAAAERVDLPHTWNRDDALSESLEYRRGTGWYRKDLLLPAQLREKRIFLYFEGANQIADVFVNGDSVGRHIGGYTAFAFEITEHVRFDGANRIVVRVDNRHDPDVPPLNADFTFYGGIYRPVWLIATDAVHFDVLDHASPGVFIDTPDVSADAATVRVRGRVVNQSPRDRVLRVVSRVLDDKGKQRALIESAVKVGAGDSAVFEQLSRPIAKPRLWSPDAPNLYRVETEIRAGRTVIDRISNPLGFRWFSVDAARGFFLNGRPLKLYGSNRHQDREGWGNALPDSLHARDVEMVKHNGFNFLRLAHYPQSHVVLGAADSLGLAVWEEIPVVNIITPSAAFAENAERMLREMIRQHYNHPSVVFWGYMNEVLLVKPKPMPDGYVEAVAGLARRLERGLKREDSTRLSVTAISFDEIDDGSGVQDVPDVLGLNLYFGWYYRTLEQFGPYLDSLHARHPQRPLLISEYGAGSDERIHAREPRAFDFSTEFQQRFHESQFAQMQKRPYLAGTAIWNQFDFGSKGRHDSKPNLNQKGLYYYDRTAKDVAHYYRAKLRTEPVLHIAVRDWPKRAGSTEADRTHPIRVYSNLREVELFANGVSLGHRKPANAAAEWIVRLADGENALVARAGTASDSATVSYDNQTTSIAVNAGAHYDYVDAQGNVWQADRAYTQGTWGHSGGQAARNHHRAWKTDADALFQATREGVQRYQFDVPPGEYDVRVLLTERKANAAGARVFDVMVNGTALIERIDLAAQYGQYTAVEREVRVQAGRGGIEVRFVPRAGETTVSGISVRHVKPPLYQSAAFLVDDTAVTQGKFRSVAVTRDRIVTNYPRAATEVMFKFSINGRDDEFPPGQDHMIYVRPTQGRIVTPVYTFGVLDPSMPGDPNTDPSSEEGAAEVTFRLDMRHVLRGFAATGEYDPPNGTPVKAADFAGVYIVGNVKPLTWDFAALKPGSPYQLTDPDGDSVYTVTLPFVAAYTRPRGGDGQAYWQRTLDLSPYPQLTSDSRLLDALYRLTLEELTQLRTEAGGIVGGAKWPSVWTRDTGWGALLGMITAAPAAVQQSLLLRVDSTGRIIQDSGTGGSWPVSTDRVVWTAAAWELYLATGNRDWLRRAYEIARRSAEADLVVAYDSTRGLFHGESSFLDWRDQSYPRWMDAGDIYAGYALGTNALHYASYRALGAMSRELGIGEPHWDRIADAVRTGMNTRLWNDQLGWYAQYLYGRRFPSASPRAELLGEALAVLGGVADSARAQRIASSMPLVTFGAPSFWPGIPDVPPYHNAAVWPQVVGFVGWACAATRNSACVEHALATIYRASALFLTNKENLLAATGHFEGTELNSDRLIGSVGAGLATVYRVLFGLRYEPGRLVFEPFVPERYAGTRTLAGVRYRDALLNVTLHGFGAGIREVRIDGAPAARAEIPATMTGAHTIEIVLDGLLPPSSITLVDNVSTPATPVLRVQQEGIAWDSIPTAAQYRVYRNGQLQLQTAARHARVRPKRAAAEYQVSAIDVNARESFMSAPVVIAAPAAQQIAPLDGRTRAAEGDTLTLDVDIARSGRHAIDVLYANGNGAISYGERAVTRTLLVNRAAAGILVMPQRGIDRWDDWGYSNSVIVELPRGRHKLGIIYRSDNRNMNGAGDALLRHVRVIELSP